MITIIILCILWYVIGVSGFIFWWTREFDFENRDIPMSLMIGIVGIFSWIIGWFIHGKPIFESNKIIFKRRTLK